MPNKHNARCRHHTPKMNFLVRNWAESDAAFRACGSLTLWVTPEAMNHWAAQPRSTPGGQGFYSDLAIETSLKLRLVFRQPRRQAEGLMASIFDLVELDLKAPDCWPRRATVLTCQPRFSRLLSRTSSIQTRQLEHVSRLHTLMGPCPPLREILESAERTSPMANHPLFRI